MEGVNKFLNTFYTKEYQVGMSFNGERYEFLYTNLHKGKIMYEVNTGRLLISTRTYDDFYRWYPLDEETFVKLTEKWFGEWFDVVVVLYQGDLKLI